MAVQQAWIVLRLVRFRSFVRGMLRVVRAVLAKCVQVKEETNCLLPLSKGIPEISFEAHQVVGGATMLSETTLASV